MRAQIGELSRDLCVVLEYAGSSHETQVATGSGVGRFARFVIGIDERAGIRNRPVGQVLSTEFGS